LLPSTPVDLYFCRIASLVRCFGGNMPYVLPNIANFWNPNSPTPPLGFVQNVKHPIAIVLVLLLILVLGIWIIRHGNKQSTSEAACLNLRRGQSY